MTQPKAGCFALEKKKKKKLLKLQDKGYKANSAFNQKVFPTALELWVLSKKKGHSGKPRTATPGTAAEVAGRGAGDI